MIKSVVLKNWKSHSNTRVDFEPGTNVIIGINGAGKSSVLEAIYFALFGPPERNFYERTLRRGEKEGEVQLVFQYKGREYRVIRRFNAKQQIEARLDGAEHVITNRPRDVDKKIAEILGMDGKTFRDAVYARQNEIASILLDSARRKELIDEMIEISEFSSLRDALITLRNRLRSWISGAEMANIPETLKKQREELRRWKKRLEETKTRIEMEKNKVAQLEEDLRQKEVELEEEKQRYVRYRDLLQEKSRVEGRIKTVQERITAIASRYGEPPADVERQLAEREKELQEVKNLEKKITEIRSRLDQILQSIAEKRRITASAPSLPENVESLERELERMVQVLREEERKLADALAELESDRRVMKEQIRNLEENLKRAKQTAEEIEQIREKYGNVKERLERGRERLEEIQKEIQQTLAAIKQEEEFIEVLRGADRCPVCGSELGAERSEELRKQHEFRLQNLRTKIDELKKALETERAAVKELEEVYARVIQLSEGLTDVGKIEKEIAEKKNALREIEAKIKENISKRTALQEQIKAKELELAHLRERIRQYRDVMAAKKDIERLESLQESLETELKRREEERGGRRSEEIQREIDRLRELAEAARLKEELNRLTEELKKIDLEMNALRDAEGRFRKLSEDVAEKRARIEEMRRQIEKIEDDEREAEQEISRIMSEIEALEKKMALVERRRKVLNVVERMIPAVEKAREQIREARIRAINKALNIIWRGIYPRRDITEIRLRPERNDYILEVKRNREWIPVSNLSGGEFYDAALALRIAISSLKARDLGLLVLDEPTHNLDADATEALAHLLNKLPEYGLFRQIIVITHDEALQKAATGTIHLFERDKDHDGPTIPKKLAITHEV